MKPEKNVSISNEKFDALLERLVRQIDKKQWHKNYAPAIDVLKMVGAGMFIASSLVAPNILQLAKPFLKDEYDPKAWKRFNIKYLKRTLQRLEQQKLISREQANGEHVIRITDRGRKKILHGAFNQLLLAKPKIWDGKWRLVSYDFPKDVGKTRDAFRKRLQEWGFYPFQESVFLHAYPCEDEVEFLREYLGIGEYVRMLQVSKIENDEEFREYFNI